MKGRASHFFSRRPGSMMPSPQTSTSPQAVFDTIYEGFDHYFVFLPKKRRCKVPRTNRPPSKYYSSGMSSRENPPLLSVCAAIECTHKWSRPSALISDPSNTKVPPTISGMPQGWNGFDASCPTTSGGLAWYGSWWMRPLPRPLLRPGIGSQNAASILTDH